MGLEVGTALLISTALAAGTAVATTAMAPGAPSVPRKAGPSAGEKRKAVEEQARRARARAQGGAGHASTNRTGGGIQGTGAVQTRSLLGG